MFETCMLGAYDTFTTKRGYVTVKLNSRKAKRIKFNQALMRFFAPIAKIHIKKNTASFDEDIIVL